MTSKPTIIHVILDRSGSMVSTRDGMIQAFDDVEPTLGEHSIPVGCQGETGGRRALLEEIKTRPGSVLLGLKSF